jgi:hypothetical protein
MSYSPSDRCTDCGKFQDCICVDVCVHCLDPITDHDDPAGCERCGCTHVVFEPEPTEEGR